MGFATVSKAKFYFDIAKLFYKKNKATSRCQSRSGDMTGSERFNYIVFL